MLGVDTEFCSVESLITGIVDNWSEKLLPHRKKVALTICITLFILGIPMCTNVRILQMCGTSISVKPNLSLFFREVSISSKSWISILLLDCHSCGFVSLKQLPSLGFTA